MLIFSEFAREIVSRVRALILLGETKDKLAETVLRMGFNNIYKVRDMNEAVRKAIAHTEPGDVLLLSPGCPSWDMYDSYKKRGQEFKEAVNKIRGS